VERQRESFDVLDKRKTPEQKKFYSGARWTQVSRTHRAIEPLCRRCRAVGQVVAAELVHHNPPLQYLIDNGLNPYNDKYLESLCFACHQKELRGKK
jgi:5-methylcytosine-specific restriction endonuclease McrA